MATPTEKPRSAPCASMNSKNRDFAINGGFPVLPVAGSKLLVPIVSWKEMYRETQATGVEFDEFWDESVREGVAYFFRWLGEPRATVLVIWNRDRLTHVECRKLGDVLLSEGEMAPVNAELARLFADANPVHGDH